MSQKTPLFRQKALDDLCAPEALSDAIEVVSAKGVWAFSVLLILLFSALMWGVFGRVPTSISGSGLLIQGKGFESLSANSSGMITSLSIGVGQQVSAGQVVAKIASIESTNRLGLQSNDILHAQEEVSLFTHFDTRTHHIQLQALTDRKTGIQAAIQAVKTQAQTLRHSLESREKLFQDGLITADTLNQLRDQLLSKEIEIKSLHHQLLQLDADREKLRQSYAREQAKVKSQANRSQLVYSQTIQEIDDLQQVRSPVDGIVTEVLKQKGDRIESGELLLTLESQRQGNANPMKVILLVPLSKAKRITPGMQVRLSPSTAKKELYGSLSGHVTFVSPFPESNAALISLFRNSALVESLTHSEPVLRVMATVDIDTSTASGLKWTSGKGPAFLISAGTLCTGDVLIEEVPPLILIFPFLRRVLGL
jgi:HlyD family secretion protein